MTPLILILFFMMRFPRLFFSNHAPNPANRNVYQRDHRTSQNIYNSHRSNY